MNRLSIAFFFDEKGIVDDYYLFLLSQVRSLSRQIVVVCNGYIDRLSEEKLSKVADAVIVRENVGFDVHAYKAALESVGYDRLADFDEILLFNHTFFGPIFPLAEMFDVMSQRTCDFWGITAHKEVIPNPFSGEGRLPFHLNSHFIAIRRVLASSPEFQQYWESVPEIETYTDSILLHESVFTEHFRDRGYNVDTYIDADQFASNYALFEEVDEVISRRCPIVKRRSFFGDPTMADLLAIDLPRAISLIEHAAEYDVGLIWRNILRTSELRNLHTNAAFMSIFDDGERNSFDCKKGSLRSRDEFCIAVFLHVYYVDMLSELIEYCNNISRPYDLIITTDDESKKLEIDLTLSGRIAARSILIRVVDRNVGADTSALLVTCRDILLSGKYHLACRLHSKKSPQDGGARARFFQRHMYENLIGSAGYAENIIEMFEDDPWIGMAFPPAIHVYYSTLGHGWFTNRTKAKEIAQSINIDVQFDEHTPVAPYGGMFWFRPQALKKLFEHDWRWSDFTDERYGDGDLPHAIERLYAYVAQDAGYKVRAIASKRQAEQNYVRLEYKVQKLAALMPPGNFAHNCHMLGEWRRAGYPVAEGTSGLTSSLVYVKEPYSNISFAARSSIAKERLRSADNRVRVVLRYISKNWRFRFGMSFHVDSINGLPNPGESVLRFAKTTTNSITVRGWALPPNAQSAFEAVMVRLDGGGGPYIQLASPCDRSDVAAKVGSPSAIACGFSCSFSARELAKGTYTARLIGVTKRGRRFLSSAATTIVVA